jgi:Tol biopolymer transport system component
LPENPRIIAWSPDDTKISFSHTTATGVELWVIEVASAKKIDRSYGQCQYQIRLVG